MEGAFVVVSTVRDAEVTRSLRALADRLRFLLHVADQPELCDFALPAVVQRGSLTVAVATGGASPGLARRMREELETLLDQRLGAFVERLAALRARVANLPPEERARLLNEAVGAVRIDGTLELPE
ncbi:MAG: hypothetical protein HYY06_12570 [Deltaproteobacteria bacterium]|nr:hypothetical protein [Deltaproteobacteria bacterium]